MRLLTVCSRPSDYVEMSALARALALRDHDVTLMYFCEALDPALPSILKETLADRRAAEGFRVRFMDIATGTELDPMSAVRPDPSTSDEPSLMRRRVRVIVENAAFIHQLPRHVRVMFRVPLAHLRLVPRTLFQAWATTARYSRFARLFAREVKSLAAGAVLIPEDIVGHLWPVLIRAAHSSGIPTLVLPYTLANRQEALQSLRSIRAFHTSENIVAAALYPRWRYNEGDLDLVRLPSGEIFAHEYLGVAPPDPWMMNSGYSDKILVDSRASFDYFRGGGIPADQMAIVGSVSQDQMFERRRNREQSLASLRAELGFMGTKPLLLISGCPNQLSAPVPFCEFSSIEEVAKFVGESLRPMSEHYDVVVRPHPNFQDFGRMLEPFGIKTTLEPTASLVPLAHVFVAFASATIRWAVACSIPAVNYDVFHYNYDDFSAAKGVVSVSGSQQFRDLVRSLTPGSEQLQRLAAHAKEDSAYWSLMDGAGLSRIEDEIRQARKRCNETAWEHLKNA